MKATEHNVRLECLYAEETTLGALIQLADMAEDAAGASLYRQRLDQVVADIEALLCQPL